jgi:8-oxo-dGTP pyrophosphatase MutT (NUDIX family)
MGAPTHALTAPWPALREARGHDAATRVPLHCTDGRTRLHVGSVAHAHLSALRRWPQWLRVENESVTLHAAEAARTDALSAMNHALRAEGLIVAWRNELFPLYDVSGRALDVAMERAATRFWGTLTLGAHCNGFVADGQGRPARIWIARRSATKPTDPNRLDNLVGGGVPAGQSPCDAVIREGWEEAGLLPEQMGGLQRGRIVQLLRDIPEGLQREWIHVYDLALPDDTVPRNQDGEVGELLLHDVAHALRLAASSEMTVDASLVMLDFALRRGLFDPATHAALSAAADGLFAGEAA